MDTQPSTATASTTPASTTPVSPATVILSRDEVLCLLSALEATSMPGLDPEPGTPRSEQESALAMEVATRGLRARGLAAIREDGQTLFHDDLLAMVGSCIYPQSALFIFHWPTDADAPNRFFGHIRESVFVAHTRPEYLLHRFDTVADKATFINSGLNFCSFGQVSSSPDPGFTLLPATFGQARAMADEGNGTGAIDLLENNGVERRQAETFVSTMLNQPQYSVWQTVKEHTPEGASGEGEIQIVKRDFTLIQNSQSAWFVGAQDGDDNTAPLRIKTVSSDEVVALVMEWL